ncbi:hypothetical protein HYX00_04445 [Candidatus Woesearchaeota archaeon]|nr:hypothetical protein [Candidatus Woesearchaeota archaeon]
MILLLLILILVPTIQGKKTEDFIVYSANLIYKDCKNNDILLKYNLTRANGTQFTTLPWPYDLIDVYNIFNAFVNIETYEQCNIGPSGRTCFSGGNLGGLGF